MSELNPRIKVSVDGRPVGFSFDTRFEFRVNETDTAVMDRHQEDQPPFVVHPIVNGDKHKNSFVAPVSMDVLPYEFEVEGHKILIEKAS